MERHGHLEKVYENALVHRLESKGILVEQQFPLQVRDEDGTILGNMGYLRACNRQVALLINFGSYQFEVRRIVLRAMEPPLTCPA